MGRVKKEGAWKWWVTLVGVPVLVAVLGAGAFWDFAQRIFSPATTRAIPEEKVEFYLSTKWNQRDERQAVIGIGEKVLIHWNVANWRGEKIFLKEVNLDARERLSKEVSPTGILAYDDPLNTVNCVLLKENPDGRGQTVIGSLRISTARLAVVAREERIRLNFEDLPRYSEFVGATPSRNPIY